MRLKLAVYNMEWMKDLFDNDGHPITEGEIGRRSEMLAEVVRNIDADILGIVEGPDTLKSGVKTATAQLEEWVSVYDLDRNYQAAQGFVSRGQQELCVIYKRNIISVLHTPELEQKHLPFNSPFLQDTTDDLVKEQYQHYRPPFEMSVRQVDNNRELARIILVHAKSKGIFDKVDFTRFVQLSERNRKKLFAECLSIRARCEQWLSTEPEMKLVVMGDINDGFGMDYIEQRYSRSAVEILLGSVWDPKKILNPVIPKPKLRRYGWRPSSSRFTDPLTHDKFDVLIDHMLVTQNISTTEAMVWNPFLEQATDELTDKVRALKRTLLAASDHFPVSAILQL